MARTEEKIGGMLDLHLKEQHLLTLLGPIVRPLTTPLSPRPVRFITLSISSSQRNLSQP